MSLSPYRDPCRAAGERLAVDGEPPPPEPVEARLPPFLVGAAHKAKSTALRASVWALGAFVVYAGLAGLVLLVAVRDARPYPAICWASGALAGAAAYVLRRSRLRAAEAEVAPRPDRHDRRREQARVTRLLAGAAPPAAAAPLRWRAVGELAAFFAWSSVITLAGAVLAVGATAAIAALVFIVALAVFFSGPLAAGG